MLAPAPGTGCKWDDATADGVGGATKTKHLQHTAHQKVDLILRWVGLVSKPTVG